MTSKGVREREHAKELAEVIEVDRGYGWTRSSHTIWRLAIAEARGLAVGVVPVHVRYRRATGEVFP